MHNAAHTGDPIPNHESAAAEDQEYINMSQAGTLTGQGMTSVPQSVVGAHSGIAIGDGNVEYCVELEGDINKSGHSKAML